MVLFAEGILDSSSSCSCIFSECCGPIGSDIVERSQKLRRLTCVIALSTVLLIAELSLGVWSQSLPLLADATHLLLDVGSLGLVLGAVWFAQQPAVDRATFGHHRAEVIAALFSGLGLIAIATLIAWEAFERLQSPQFVISVLMFLGAGCGLLVNGFNLTLLHKHSHHDLNVRGAFLHIAADTASVAGILFVAIAINCFGWIWADAIASLLIATLSFFSAIPLIRCSVEILMEYTPPSVDLNAADTGLQQGQGMHGTLSRADTYNNMAAIGPDFKSNFVDPLPVSNVDVPLTIR